jgi:twinkle protein
MVKQATGLDRPTPAYIDAVGVWLQDRAWLFNVMGSATIARLLEVFAYASRRYGIRHFVIDSLMMTDVPEDGPGSMTAQKAAVQKLADFAKRHGAHVHLVAHPRKGRDESQAPGKLDVAGSSKITDAADNVFTVWSARKEEGDDPDDKPDGCLELQKQRNGDTQHKKLWLFFNRAAMQFCPSSDRRAVAVGPFSAAPSSSGADARPWGATA